MMTDAELDQPVTKREAINLTNALTAFTRKFRWQQLLSAGVVIALLVEGYLLIQQRQEAQCVASLAAASADRTGALAPLNNAKNAAADAQSDASSNLLFHAITTFGDTPAQRTAALRPDTAAFTAAHLSYIAARDAYNKAAAENKPPKAHAFHC